MSKTAPEKGYVSEKVVLWIHANFEPMPEHTRATAKAFGWVHPANHPELHAALSRVDPEVLRAETEE